MPSDVELDDERNPLAFLDKLLPDEKDSNLHFGDVRFWKHLEYIDSKQIYRLKSLEYKTMKMMMCEALFYVLFLACTTGYIVQVRSPDVYEARRQQLDYWGGCRRGLDGERGEGGCVFDSIKEPMDIMDWMKNDMAPKAFTDRDIYPSLVETPSIFRLHEGTAPFSPRYVGDTKTVVLLGTMRIRQQRVRYNTASRRRTGSGQPTPVANDCQVLEIFEDIQSDCFPRFTSAARSTVPWNPQWAPEYLAVHYEFSDVLFTEQTEMIGYHGVYPGDGFYFDLPLNVSGAQMRLQELAEWQWIDDRTRAIIIEFSTLAPNVNVVVHNRILFEVLATGGVMWRHEAFGLRIIDLSLALMVSDNTFAFLYMILMCALHIMLILYVGFIIFKNGPRQYFSFFWSWFDVIILILFIIMFIINIAVMVKASLEPYLYPQTMGDPSMFFPIGKLVADLELSGSLMAVHGLFAWLRVLKYFSLIDSFQALVRVIERSMMRLIMFSSLLGVVTVGFTVAFHVAFGGEDDVFSTLRGSFVAVVTAPAGGVNFDPILKKDDLLGPILILMYIMIILFLLLTVFCALVVDCYSVCTYEMDEVKRTTKSNPTQIFLWTYWKALNGVKLTGKESEEDKGGPDEQEIPLALLPEALQLTYSETKNKMLQILDTAQKAITEAKLEKLRMQGLSTTGEPLHGDGGGAGAANATVQSLKDAMGSEADMGSTVGTQGFPAMPEEEDPKDVMVRRVQMQRMLDDDGDLREICQTGQAVDVVRQFKVDQSTVDPYEAVAKLQASVVKQLQDLEKKGANLTFDEMQTLRTVSQELHSALTDSQKEWRAELLSVMQMASLLSRSLVDLTKKLDEVQRNQNTIKKRVKPV